MVAIREVLPIALVGAGALALGLTGVLKSEPEVHSCEYPPAWVIDSVHRVVAGGRTGGSSVLTDQGWHTAAHVLSMRAGLEVRPESDTGGSKVHDTWVDAKSDAGYFQADRDAPGVLSWRTDVPTRGERVWAIGYPLGKELTVTTGHVHGLTKENKWLYHSAPAMSGMSGGAVVTCGEQRGWNLVGITAAIALAPQRTPMGVIGNVVPFMGYASTYGQHMDNVLRHSWEMTPW